MRFIVLEEGASAFEPPSPSSDAAMEVVVLVQAEGEASLELEARALRRLTQMERNDRAVREAVIAAGAASAASRARLSHALYAHMASHGSGELVLAADDARDELRHELMDLAEALTHGLSPANVGVRVLFAPEPQEEEISEASCHECGSYAVSI